MSTAVQFENALDRKIREDLDRMFGDRESAKEIRNAVLLARKGLINDETIAQYCRSKEEEIKAYRDVLTEVNPDYAFKTGDELLSEYNKNDVLSESIVGSCPTAECRNSEHGGNQDALSVN